MWKRRVFEGDIDLHIANSWEIKKKKILKIAGILTRHYGTAGNNSSIYPNEDLINKANESILDILVYID